MKKHLPPLLCLACVALLASCAPAKDADGFTLDLEEAIAARGHDFGCFQGQDDPAFTLQLAIVGEGDDEERVAVVIQDAPENFLRGTWTYESDLAGTRTLSVSVPEADLAVTTSELEMKYGALLRFPANASECRVRGFLGAAASPAAGTFRCEDPFFDRVDYILGAGGSLVVEEERDDEGQITAQTDFGAYYKSGSDVFLLRPEREEPAKRAQQGALEGEALTLADRTCPKQAQ